MTDADLIRKLGGATALARRLGYDVKGGTQRVQNWIVRGIPAAVKLEHPDLFLPHLRPAPRRAARHESR